MKELDREWDVDPALMVDFAVVGSAAFALSGSGSAPPAWARLALAPLPKFSDCLTLRGAEGLLMGVDDAPRPCAH